MDKSSVVWQKGWGKPFQEKKNGSGLVERADVWLRAGKGKRFV